MKKRVVWAMSIGVAVASLGGVGSAADLSVFDVQSNTSDGDASVYAGQIHNVLGGVVRHIWSGFNDRVYLQDPAHPTWGAIVVKDGEGGELTSAVSVGDWVSFQNIYVDEYGGTTLLQYRRSFAPEVSFAVESSGNAVPASLLLTAADVAYPPVHSVTEAYESMMVTLEDVTIGQMDLGRKDDNYELLQNSEVAWATDYMNTDAGAPYDPRITPGAFLESITGVVEQNAFSGWDYYQLNTRSAADIVPEPTTAVLLFAGVMVVAGRRRRR